MAASEWDVVRKTPGAPAAAKGGSEWDVVDTAPVRATSTAEPPPPTAAPEPPPEGETNDERLARYRESDALGVPIGPPSTETERNAWGPTIRSIPETVRATLAQTMAGIYAREFADLEEAAAVGGLHGPDFEGKSPEEAVALVRGKTERELGTARAAGAELQEQAKIPRTLGQRAVVNTASSLAQSAPALAVGMATRNPTLAALSMVEPTSGQQFAEYANLYADEGQERSTQGWAPRSDEERAKDLKRAEFHADVQGIIEAGTELLPFRELFKPGSGFAGRLIDVLREELPGESIATITQTLDDTLARNPNANAKTVLKGLQEGFSQLPDTWAATILQSTLMAGAVSSAERAAGVKAGEQAGAPEEGVRPIAPPAGGAATPKAADDGWEPVSAAGSAPEEIERYQFMRNREGTSLQMEVVPLTQERFIKYVRPNMVQGYANTLEEYRAKHPGVTHLAITRKGPDAEWKMAWVSTPEGIMSRLRTHEAKVRQVQDFDSPEAKEWGAIDEAVGTKRDINAIDKSDSLITAISKLGGLNREEAESHGIDPKEFGRRGAGIKRLFTEKGRTAEDLAETLSERGYAVNDGGTFSGQALIDKLHDELAGRATTRTDAGMEQQLEEKAREHGAAEERRYRSQREQGVEDFYADMPEAKGYERADRNLGEPEDYPDDFDQPAKNLADMAVLARGYADEETVQDAMTASSDEQAAAELQEIIRNGRAKERAAQPAPPSEPVAARAPEGAGAAAAAAAVEPAEEKPQGVKSDESQGIEAQETLGRDRAGDAGEGAPGREVPEAARPSGSEQAGTEGGRSAGRSADVGEAGDTASGARAETDHGDRADDGGGARGERGAADAGAAVRPQGKAPSDLVTAWPQKRGDTQPLSAFGFKSAEHVAQSTTSAYTETGIVVKRPKEVGGKTLIRIGGLIQNQKYTEVGLASVVPLEDYQGETDTYQERIDKYDRGTIGRGDVRGVRIPYGKSKWYVIDQQYTATDKGIAIDDEHDINPGVGHRPTPEVTPEQEAVRNAIALKAESLDDGSEMAPPPRDEDVAALEERVTQVRDRASNEVAKDALTKALAAEYGSPAQRDALERASQLLYRQQPSLSEVVDEVIGKIGFTAEAATTELTPAPQPTLADLKKNLAELKDQQAQRVSDARLGDRIANIEKLIAAQEGPTQKTIDTAAHEAATSPKNALPQPSHAQKEAENYKVGAPVTLHGVTWRVENPKGSYRTNLPTNEVEQLVADYRRGKKAMADYKRGMIPQAVEVLNRLVDDIRGATDVKKRLAEILKNTWVAKLGAHYARALGVKGADGDTLDAFLGPQAADQTLPVYVFDTNKLRGGGFDEHKVMIGFPSEEAARKTFLDSYNDGVGQKILANVTPMSSAQFQEWVRSGDLSKPAAGSIMESAAPAAGVAGERTESQEPEGGQPAGAQPGGVPGSGETAEAGRVRDDERAGGASGAPELDPAWVHGGRGVGGSASGVLETAGQAALDFAVDHRPERQSEPRVDGRSAEVKRAKEHGARTPAPNYVITADDAIGKGGIKTKARQNLDSIRLVKELQRDLRQPTADEQAVLVKYVGWGGMPQIFDAEKADWAKEHAELKELLTADEYAAARRSTQDAHYTSETVVRGMYDALKRLGFTGGKLLEPAAGIGHFFGMMPEALSKHVQAAGVELDPLTSAIANYLYPKIRTSTQGFQDFAVPDGYYDAVIGNPPFGDQKLYDGERKHLNDFSIHNYFIAKAVDVTRPGGVVAVVVSRYFMDSSHKAARTYIDKHAKLLGAIRLPNTAFADNANTQVVTDIVFLQKRDEPVMGGAEWVEAKRDSDGNHVNAYFLANPRMVLGRHATTGSMYKANEYTVEPTGDLSTQLRDAVALLPKDVVTARSADHQASVEGAVKSEPVAREVVEHVQVYGYFEQNGRILQRVPDVAGEAHAEPVEVSGPSRDRMLQLIKVRDLVRAQLRMELADSPGMEPNRRQLNQAYDRLVKQYGYAHAQGNKNVFSDDPSYPLLLSLESDYDRGVSATTARAQGVAPRAPSADKAAIFNRRVLIPFKEVEKVHTATDALLSSLSERGHIDPTYIEKVYGQPFASVMEELGDRVFEEHDGSGWTTSDDYLSGNVKAKLKAATAAAARDARFQRNVQALTRVIPADLEPVDIAASASSPWIPAKYMTAFAKHLFGEGTDATVIYVPAMGKFSARIFGGDRVLTTAKWGTERVSGTDLLQSILTNGSVVVYDRGPGDTRIINQDATLAAQDKVEQIKREFEDWVWQDDARRADIARIYNDTFNTDVERTYDGSHIGVGPEGRTQPLRGANPEIELRQHQKNYVWRFIQTGKALADHVVGAGKTYAAITAVMERKRIGLINKPMFPVPNHLTEQWGSDFKKLYPGANVLVATKKDFERANRRKFFAKIATGEWDGIIVAHSSFERIAMPVEALKRFTDQAVADIEASQEALKASGTRDKRSIKQMEKQKERLLAKLKSRMEGKEKDDVVGLDELGVDALIVDEAHAYKNLMYSTSRRNVAGLGNTEGSERAMDMFVKSQYILERNGGQNLMFLTGTPVSNSIAEMYHVQRYMDSETLRARGLFHFDAWANTFASLYSDWEVSTSGVGMKQITRFRKFQNFAELMKMYRSFADVVTQSDLKKMRAAEGKPPLTPPVKGGGPAAVAVDASPMQRMYMAEIVKRADSLKSGNKEDNMLLITSHARQAALDMRLRDPGAPDYAGSKVAESARRIKELYDEWKSKKGTQLVFIDLSTPKNFQSEEQRRIADIIARAEEFEPDAMEQMAQLTPDEIASASATFDVYNDLKAKLVALGIPENEIEFIHQANTELRKEALFERMRQGVTRVLFGSTAKMGAGMNVQRRLVGLHHLDAPWKPSDLEQREGRIIRQGNVFYDGDPDKKIAPIPDFAVTINRYVTKGTYDARAWQVLENKARFIEQMRSASMTERNVEDIAGEAATAAAMKAAASDNPLIEEEIRLRGDIRKLEAAKRDHTRQEHAMQGFIKRADKIEAEHKQALAAFDADLAKIEPQPKDGFAGIKVEGRDFTDKKTGGMGVALALTSFIKSKRDEKLGVGTYRGFSYGFFKSLGGYSLALDGKAYNYATTFDAKEQIDPLGVITRLDNLLARIPAQRADEVTHFERQQKELETARATVGKPFGQQAELDAKLARQREVLKELTEKKKDEAGQAEGLEAHPGDAKTRRRGLGVQVVEPFVRDLVSRWKGLKSQVVVTQRNGGLSGVPETVRHGIAYLDPQGRMMGLNDSKRGVIYLFADNLPSLTEAERILIHEAKGHAGAHAYLGDEYEAYRDKALELFPAVAAEQAAHTGADLRTTAGRNRVGDEIFAVLAEHVERGTATAKMQEFMDRLYEAAVKFLRSIGLTYGMTRAEFRNIIRNAADDIEHGTLSEGRKPTLFAGEDIQTALSDPDNEEELNRVRAEEHASRQKSFFERVLRDGQPVDETFALLMRPFGSLDDRRVFHTDPRIKAAARAALEVGKEMLASRPFQWMHGYVQRAYNAIDQRYGVGAIAQDFVENAKRGLIDRYGQSEELRTRSLQVEADRRSMLLMGEDLLKRLLSAGVESKQAEIMYRMMVADGTTEEEKASLGADIQKLAPEIRETLDYIGREYVELGLLSAETFEFWRHSYLPRSYMKYEQERGSLARYANQVLDRRRKRIIGKQFQQRGIEITKSQARILRDVPEDWWGRRKEQGQSDTYLKGAHFVVLENVTAEGDLTIDMPGMDTKKIEERVTSRIYWPADLPIPEKYRGYANRGVFVVRAAERGQLALWRDYTQQERTDMTEIVDVRYALAKAFMQASNDIANGRYFRDIAMNPDWASTTDPTGNSPNASEHLWATQAGAEWVRVPETKAAGTNTARYGALAGLYVRSEVWNDVNQTVQMQKAGFWRSLMTQWKLNKTARNPVVHLNNIMSNVLLMDMIDVRARDLLRGIQSYIGEDAYYRSALEHGAFGADIVTQELKSTLLGPVLKELEAEQRAGGIGIMGAVGMVTRAIRSLDQEMRRIYQLEDEVFRMATYMREIERGATPAEAAAHAREQFLNYDIRAPWVNAARQSLLPFIAYTYRAVPVIAKSIADRPWKLAKYYAMAYLFNALAYALMDDDDEDEERATLRPEEQGYTWLGIERMLRAPFNDRFGNPVFWDIRRFIPAGDVFDMNQGSSAVGIPAPVQFGGPLMTAFELMLNKQGFTGEPITNELTDTGGEKAAKVADYLWKSAAPTAPWIPGSWYWSKIKAAATGELDPLMREYSVPLAVSSSIGLKLKPHDVNLQRRYQLMDAEKVERALTEQARSLAIDLARHRINREYYDAQVAVIQEKVRRLNDRRRELAPR